MGFCNVCKQSKRHVVGGLCLRHSSAKNRRLSQEEKDMITAYKKKVKEEKALKPKSQPKRPIPNSPLVGFVYLVENKSAGIQKVGVTGSPISRLSSHHRKGFGILEIFVGSPETASRVEQDFVNFINSVNGDKGTIKFNGSDDEKFVGYTESWKSEFLRIGSISAIVDISGLVRIPIPDRFR